jgi:hypothetical protein
VGWGVGYFAVGLVAHDDEVLVVPARPELSLWVEQQEPRVVPPTPRQIQAPDEPYLWFSSARASFRGQHEKKRAAAYQSVDQHRLLVVAPCHGSKLHQYEPLGTRSNFPYHFCRVISHVVEVEKMNEEVRTRG